MMINLKVRMKNKDFWIALIPAVLILIQMVAGLFNVVLPINARTGKLLDIINTVFMILAIIGVINDPTTYSLQDSTQAMGYDSPKKSR